MTTLRAQLAEQLGRFDDEAFAALANRGLLRRAQKDLEKKSAEIVDESPESLVVSLGGQRIRFDARGPAFAQCSCPASSVCQHILAAAIVLQRQPAPGPEAASAAAVGEAEPEQAPLASLHTSLLAMSAAQLSKYAGKTGYRWAWQFVQDLSLEHAAEISGERYVVVAFRHPRISFRYMGGGVDALIGDTRISQVEKYRVAAVLAYQRAHGVELSAPEPAGKARRGALDLGKDHALAEPSDEMALASRVRLRASVSQLLQECVELGLSHLSQGIHERYSTLAVWAQGAEYYRLALLLRRIADHVEMLLERAGGADEHRLLDEIALAYGLVCALEYAAHGGSAPSHLVGRARSRYEQTGSLELVGLGASAWRSGSGYVGLTLLFWSTADKGFVSCTDARPEIQRGFNPIARYKAAGPWSGLGAPSLATGRRLVLSGAQLNSQGRLSASESTSATVQGFLSADTLTGMLRPAVNWATVLQVRSLARRSLLAEPSPMNDWAVLRPSRFGAPKFDTVRQTVVWPVFDDLDQALNLELAFSDYSSHAIERIERTDPAALRDGTLLVVRLHNTAAGPVGEPLSLVRPDASGGCIVDALHFDTAPEESFISNWLGKLRRGSNNPPMQPSTPHAATVPSSVREMRHWLQRQAERGIDTETADRALTELKQHVERAAAAGFSAYAKAINSGQPVQVAILRNHYLCMQYERLLVDDDEEVA